MFKLSKRYNGELIEKVIKFGRFPNGELYLPKLSNGEQSWDSLYWAYEDNEDFLKLALIQGAATYNNLIIGYLPYSRMDRENENYEETLTSSIHLIESIHRNTSVNYKVIEPHSRFGMQFDPLYTSVELFNEVFKQEKSAAVVLPDAGAHRRYSNITEGRPFVLFDKQRDFKTGEITSIDLYHNESEWQKTAIIIDDLCSRGGTFLGVAKKLKQIGFEKVILVVTHLEQNALNGICNSNLVDEIHAIDTLHNNVEHPKVTYHSYQKFVKI